MLYADPDFGFLFFNSDWQATRKAAKRLPLTAEWQGTVSTWIQQATLSDGLRRFVESLRRHGESHTPDPDADLAQLKAEVLDLLNTGSKRSRKDALATLQFYRQSLAVFPERFLEPVPALYFSEPLVQVLRHAPLYLRQ
jgi:hypothetical protein